MKTSFYMAIFLFTLLFSLSTKLKKLQVEQPPDTLLQQIFSIPKSTACADTGWTQHTYNEKKKKNHEALDAVKADLWWVKKWGYGDSAYFFDYLTPLILNDFLYECNEIYTDLLKINSNKDGGYLDPFDYMNFITPDMSDAQKNSILQDFHKINKNYKPEIFNISVNAVQIHKSMRVWKWIFDSNRDYSKDFVIKYDANGDGRINPRELILGAIDSNRFIIASNKKSSHLFERTVPKLNAIFYYCDCNSDGFITAKELWDNIPSMLRGSNNYNIFNLGSNNGLRTASINDFILKAMDKVDGAVTLNEFVTNILLGFWNRQLQETQILYDTSRSLIDLRWDSTDSIDLLAQNIIQIAANSTVVNDVTSVCAAPSKIYNTTNYPPPANITNVTTVSANPNLTIAFNGSSIGTGFGSSNQSTKSSNSTSQNSQIIPSATTVPTTGNSTLSSAVSASSVITSTSNNSTSNQGNTATTTQINTSNNTTTISGATKVNTIIPIIPSTPSTSTPSLSTPSITTPSPSSSSPSTPSTSIPVTSTPSTSTPSTSTPSISTPSTSTPSTLTPNTSTPSATVAKVTSTSRRSLLQPQFPVLPEKMKNKKK